MPKTITSPVKRFPGTVTLPDSYGFGELIQWEHHMARMGELTGAEQVATVAEAILPMVSEWHITGLPEKPEALPATPRVPIINLVTWLMREIGAVIDGGEDLPPFSESVS